MFRLDVTPERIAAFVGALEQLIARDIRHPAIAAPIAAGIEGHAAYLAMEHAVGEALDVTPRAAHSGRGGDRGPMPLADAVRIVEAVAAAIDHAASRGVRHGMLHPRDVLIWADGPHVTGFGIAEALERIGVRPPVRRPYAAPDTPSDVYALAAIAYELISGRRMTPGGWDELSAEDGPELREAFAAALSEDPGARPAAAGAFAGQLRRAANISLGETVESQPLIEPEEPEDVLGLGLLEPALDEPALDRFAAADAAFDLKIDFDTAPLAEEPPAAGPPVEEQLHVEEPPAEESYAEEPYVEPPVEVETSVEPLAEPPADRFVEPPPPEPVPLPMAWEAQPPRAFQVEERAPVARRWAKPLGWFVVTCLGVGGVMGYALRNRPEAPAEVAEPAEASAPESDDAVASTTDDAPPAPPVAQETRQPAPAPSRPASGAAAAPVPMPAARARLTIRSTPAGAAVVVNGRTRGKTPLNLRDLPFGSYNIRLARDGFASESRQVRLTTAQPSATLAIPLKAAPARPASGSGALVVESRPSGARVFVNNRLVGSTPLTIPGLPAGPATVRIEMDGYRPWVTTANVGGGEPLRLGASLERR